MKTVTKFITNDGREFDDQEVAIKHEKAIVGKQTYVFWLDGKIIEVDQISISGATVRAQLGSDRPAYNIYVEDHPDDKQVKDADTFLCPRKFYAVPNSNWGG